MPAPSTSIVLTPNLMRKIARYEFTFRDILGDATLDDVEMSIPEVYTYTLDDLTKAIRNLKAADPLICDFGADWYEPIMQLYDEFDLDRACGNTEDEDDSDGDDTPEYLRISNNLPVSDSYWFDLVWYDLDDAWTEYDFGEFEGHISEILNFDLILAELERYASNKGKPIEEWVFTESEMLEYVMQFDDDKALANASEEEMMLCRRMLDELCDKNQAPALRIKGYACYGGNRLYDCDWPTSRDCMLRLFEKTDDPQYANTLGYIFYYGRCTVGVPEYEKAFHYFEIAAANGLYEGMYKLADMYRHGYGCGKSPRTARALYSMVYDDSRKRFLEGETNSFADAALRMGNVYAKGIDVMEDARTAYLYYLQADYAAKLRAQEDDFFGNTTVVMNVRKALEETKAKLPEDFFSEYVDVSVPYIFRELSEEDHRCRLYRERLVNGDVRLRAMRLKTKSRPNIGRILVTIPELNLCERTIFFDVTALQPEEVWFAGDEASAESDCCSANTDVADSTKSDSCDSNTDDGNSAESDCCTSNTDTVDSVKFDYCDWNEKDDAYEFYYDDVLTARIKCERYRIMAPVKD